MKVYERLADAFKAEGTTHVFGMMGDGNMYWMNALIRRGVAARPEDHRRAHLESGDQHSDAAAALRQG